MDLSLIIPVFNVANFISGQLETMHAFLGDHVDDFEIVVVDDGSTDETVAKIRELSLPCLRLVRLSCNQGKYGALKVGMKEASGDCKIFTDADLPYDLEAIPYINRLVKEQRFHLVIGDRSLPNSTFENGTSTFRRLTHRALRSFIRLLFLSQIYDSQCGLKGFRADTGDELFRLIRDVGFAGDLELLYLGLKYNLDIKRIPVRLRRAAPTSVRVARTSVSILKRALLLSPLWHLGYYRSELLSRAGTIEYWDNDSRDLA